MAGDDAGRDARLYVLPEAEARRRLRTTNALEREHEEIRRRTRVIRIFPNEPSFLRLATALAADRSDAWAKRRYIVPASPTINVPNVLRRSHVA
ncbi:MAG: transposase [Gemmatimonadaceae bacterium]